MTAKSEMNKNKWRLISLGRDPTAPPGDEITHRTFVMTAPAGILIRHIEYFRASEPSVSIIHVPCDDPPAAVRDARLADPERGA